MKLFISTFSLVVSFALVLECQYPAPAADRPNVVVFLSDDQGWGDLSSSGNQNLATPNVDSLADDGASFDRFFVCPVCSPTRAEFLTGRYHPRGGVYSTSTGGERLDLDETTIADAFQAAGYATAAFGKWHNGMQYPYHPNGRGFEEFYGFCSGHWGNYFSPMLEHNGQIVRGDGFVIDDFTNRALTFIDYQAREARPFFVYLPYNTPHSPMQVPDRWWNKFREKELALRHRDPQKENVPHTRAALAMCENIDWNVGRILQRLDELDIAEDTIVVYFCDNGPNGHRWNDGMKGHKGTTDEGGVRSPLYVRWPGHIEPGSNVGSIAAAIDLLPTLADLAGIEVTSKTELDGVSLKPLLTLSSVSDLVASEETRVRMIFSHWRGRVSVRTQQYRLDHEGRLFDMLSDPGQHRDIASEQPAVAERLRAAVAKWKQELLPGLGEDDRPLLIGHPDFQFTQLPARDAQPHGNIQRSNRYPNCSFFTNWTDPNDRITWDVEVVAPGTYDAVLYCTCAEQDIGSSVELSLNDSRLTGQILTAHDPPLHGAADDRVERTESYVKDFRPVKLGSIALEKGRGTLTLRALKIPGTQALDFRLLMLSQSPERDRASE